ncbi:transporter [Psychromonas marina]|uniref:Transporter n=1 Tax=Psychromonas marina TaxID=88364 RepID=A0ABQ6E1Y1_9GAMM|nr:divalent metal cation transporter [Psychromonas marina]GLS91409.1 transporter [Psychromonas marina]
MQSNTLAAMPTTVRFKQVIHSLGPGIMMATAAVGGSHLIASTKAGAVYGWQLAALILLINLLKYPFFRAGVQYTMGTSNSLVHGYAQMGNLYLYLFTALCAISAIVNTAALGIFSASLLAYLLPFSLPLPVLSGIVFVACLTVLLRGQYTALNHLSKIIMLIVVITSVSAVIIAANQVQSVPTNFTAPSSWNVAAIGLIVITMGWMPAPIEIATLNSLWLKRQQREQKVTNQSALFDFNVGYIMTALLALVFLALGRLVLHGYVDSVEAAGTAFTDQLIRVYAATIGEWSRYLIASIGFLCIFGSTITVIDGYSRALAEAKVKIENINSHHEAKHQRYMFWICACAMLVILFWASSLMTMLNFAMMLAFATTPVFAFLNYKLVAQTLLPKELRFSSSMKALSWVGLFSLISFLVVFIWWKWLM